MTQIGRSLLLALVLCVACSQKVQTPAPTAAPGEAELVFWDVPKLERAFVSLSPEQQADGVPVGQLGVHSGKREHILALAEKMANDSENKYDSLLVVHKGKLLFEGYFNRGRIDLPHPQASATKAYTALALGRAIQLGHLSINDLNRPVASFVDSLDPTRFVEGAERVTLTKALTMRSGIRIDDEKKKAIYEGEEAPKETQLLQTVLEQSAPISSKAQSFKYQEDPTLVMQVLDSVVPGSAAQFIEEELLEKLGIRNYKWSTAPSGLPESGWGTAMTS
ncbi:MAG: serine hydrolase domain-containing protein, partial [Myxococcota bacterium]